MQTSELSRREWLSRGLAAAASLGFLGATSKKPQVTDLTGDVCTLTCSQILGPCYYDTADLVRHDITEGKPGLQSLLGFQIVDADTCQPVADAAVDIWHTDAGGAYSAPINAFCNGSNPAVRQQRFCRGVQRTDASGWAYFKTIYPGWYPGRTPHIHATIRRGTTAMVTTQFYFPDALSEYVYRNHATYRVRPNRDTTNATDGVIGGAATRVNPYLFNSKLIFDESLVALKVIAIRSNPTTCKA